MFSELTCAVLTDEERQMLLDVVGGKVRNPCHDCWCNHPECDALYCLAGRGLVQLYMVGKTCATEEGRIIAMGGTL